MWKRRVEVVHFIFEPLGLQGNFILIFEISRGAKNYHSIFLIYNGFLMPLPFQSRYNYLNHSLNNKKLSKSLLRALHCPLCSADTGLFNLLNNCRRRVLHHFYPCFTEEETGAQRG